MTDIVKVTPERLKSTAASLNQTGASIKKTTSQMLALDWYQSVRLER